MIDNGLSVLLWVAYLGKYKGALIVSERTLNVWCDELQSNSFTVHLHKKANKNKKKRWLVHPTFQSWFHFPQSCPADWGNLFCFAGEWSGRVRKWQGSLFSLTLITSFTNLQIYNSTVCKGVSAITSSVVSRPVMTTGPMKLLCWN